MRTEEQIRQEIEGSNIYLDYWKDNLSRDKAYNELNQIPNDEKAIILWEYYIAGLKFALGELESGVGQKL